MLKLKLQIILGKTCLIKALTGSDSLTPKDKLFATLDITAHAGVLPGNLKVIYMDTIGFISDIPTNLLECFQATLEDAMIAVSCMMFFLCMLLVKSTY